MNIHFLKATIGEMIAESIKVYLLKNYIIFSIIYKNYLQNTINDFDNIIYIFNFNITPHW